MTTWSVQTEERLRQGFKSFNPFMLLLWRLGLGRWVNLWPKVGGRIMVLTHTGRKTGLRRRTPVNYAEIDGELYCTAGFGQSFGSVSQPPAPTRKWKSGCRKAGGLAWLGDHRSPGALPIMRQVLINSGFAARAAGVDPIRMSDAELQAATASYRLLHIRRTTACTGQLDRVSWPGFGRWRRWC